ncbi:MAG: energy transducer TonB [Balneolaceae bacterium]
MKIKLLIISILGFLFLSGCFENEQELYVCEETLVVAEEMPQPEKGIAELQNQVIYPEEAKELGVEGRVTVNFVINKIGRVINPQVVRGIGAGADEEAMRVVRNSTWRPAFEKGEPVCINFALSINFRL